MRRLLLWQPGNWSSGRGGDGSSWRGACRMGGGAAQKRVLMDSPKDPGVRWGGVRISLPVHFPALAGEVYSLKSLTSRFSGKWGKLGNPVGK